MDLVTYLGFDGTCEAAFQHYEKVLGGKILMMMRNGEAPGGGAMPPEQARRIMHARLQVGDRLLMGGDAPGQMVSRPQGFCVNYMADDPAAAERIFQGLAEAGTVTMPIAETFWARRFGMLVDRFGTPWMVNCEKPMGAEETPCAPFTLSRTFAAPREVVWACFTDPARMQKWWGPKGATVITSKMDLKPGGTYLYGMRMPDGSEMWGRQVYREIVPRERLVLVNSFSDPAGGLTRHPMAPTWPLELHSTFTFVDAGPGQSTFTVRWTPIFPTPEERAAFEAGHASMTGGWGGTLDQLAAYLATT
jgi:uncharacterized glyoxalase superfamily protein PhnB/uncharacterized protein YndB with AHSA1/START domain